jgi:hypothetical protein
MTDTRQGAIPEELSASVQHLEMISESLESLRAKVKRLESARADTLCQIATASSRLIRNWPAEDILALYERLNSPGFYTSWSKAGLPHPQALKSEIEMRQRYLPNDPQSGGWVGEWVLKESNYRSYGEIPGSYPRDWTPVVYVLYGADASPVYCGSTEHFKTRLNKHHLDGKRFVAWRAVRCADREKAFALEDRLLKQSCPPLNKKAGR